MSKKKRPFYTTREVAEAAGITRATLQEWVATKRVDAPELPAPGLGVRVWTEADVERVKAYKELAYRKLRGQPRKYTVKFHESVWQLNAKRQEMTDGTRTFRFHPVGKYADGPGSKIVPIAWQEKRADGSLVDVTEPKLLQILNTGFRLIFGRRK